MALVKFSDIPIRANGQKIEASWFNSIRLLLVQIFGDIAGEERQSIGNTDTSQDITGLTDISSLEFSQVDFEYQVRRKDDVNDVFQSSQNPVLHFKTSSQVWVLTGHDENIRGDDAKINFELFQQDLGGGDIRATVRYSTTDLGGGGVHTGDLNVRSKKWTI